MKRYIRPIIQIIHITAPSMTLLAGSGPQGQIENGYTDTVLARYDDEDWEEEED